MAGCGALFAAAVVAALVTFSAPAGSEQPDAPEARRAQTSPCAFPTDQNLTQAEGYLNDHAGYARWWYRGWNSVFVLGAAVQGTRAGLEDDRGARADLIASAVKASFGLARSVWAPPHAMHGSEELGELPATDSSSCRLRLARAEEMLERNARQSVKERKSWKPHLFNVLLNVTAAVVVAESYDYDQAYWSALLGAGIGEVRIFSYPWHAEKDWEAYESGRIDRDVLRRHELARPSWGIAPFHQGALLVLRY